MKRNIRILALSLSLALMIGVTACSAPSTPPAVGDSPSPSAGTNANTPTDANGPIKMACLAPFSGNFAQYGEGYKVSIEMALAEYNAKGGYNGRDLVCEYYDDKMDAKEAVTVAQKIVNEDYIICVGPWSSTIGFAVGTAFGDAKMGLYGISTSHTDFVGQNKYIARQSPDIIQFTDSEARLAYNEYGLRKAAILNYVDDMATTAASRFEKDFTSLGGEVVTHETYMTGAVDFTAQLTKMISTNPDYIWLQGSYSDVARIIQQARELDFKGHISIPAAAYNQGLIDLAGKYAENCSSIVHIDPDLPEAVALGDKYRAACGQELNAHSFMAYDAACHVTQALTAVGPDRQAIIDYIRNDKEAQGTFGTVKYYDGSPVAPVFPVVIKDGKFTTMELKKITREDLAVLFD